jgi:hypothetical protein
MAFRPDPEKLKERTLLLVTFALFLFASPFTITLAWGGASWLLPYLLWLLIIAIGVLIHYRYDRDDF